MVAPQQRAVAESGEQAAPVDGRVRGAAAVRLERSRRGGHEPDLGVVRVDGERPRVAALPTGVGGVPRHPAVVAPGRAGPGRVVFGGR
jgi:hypothetical protein